LCAVLGLDKVDSHVVGLTKEAQQARVGHPCWALQPNLRHTFVAAWMRYGLSILHFWV